MDIGAYYGVPIDKVDWFNGLEIQKKFFSGYIKRTGDNLVRLYADIDISKQGMQYEFQKEENRVVMCFYWLLPSEK